MKDLQSIKQKLAEVATVVNAFTSEAVQLRVLEYILEDTDTPDQTPIKTLPATPHGKRNRPKTKPSGSEKSKTPAINKGRPSAATLLDKLLTEGFFNKKRTIAEISEHLGSKLGRHFKANELSPVLLRFVRDQKLERDKNADDQYEYVKK